MKNDKVVSIESRLERWHSAYELENLKVSVSNHGRMHIQVNSEVVFLDLTDSVALLGRVSKSFEKHSGL
jgi:hypothetical protein